jgi:hypothetical protein
LGGVWQSGPVVNNLARENRSRRNLHGNEEEGKEKEETLTACETILRTDREFSTGLSGEAPPERRFLLEQLALGK